MVQHIAQAPRHQLDRAIWQNAGLDHQAETGFGHLTGGGGWFDDGGHTGEQRRGELFQHAPNGEVEGVDMHRDALQRRADVAPHELTGAAQLFHGTVQIDLIIRHLATALGGIDLHRADAAIHVDQVVGLRTARVERQLV